MAATLAAILLDDEASAEDERQHRQQGILPAPLSPQSTVESQPSLDAAVNGAARHSDDYTAFLAQHPATGAARAPRRPLTALGGKTGTAERQRERERSYSDYGVYESPVSQTEDMQESGVTAAEEQREEEAEKIKMIPPVVLMN